ncbi:MAG: DUF2164 domain-containing protein [Pseudomonadaceae bacterium]|nr:DUF2164 domain-containing protein [Pseudomonadaceae bacterium]
MSDITFSEDEKAVLVGKIKLYFADELDQEIGQFPAQFLLDFFAEEIGPYFYNRGVYDAAAILSERMESVTDSLFELEKPTEFAR